MGPPPPTICCLSVVGFLLSADAFVLQYTITPLFQVTRHLSQAFWVQTQDAQHASPFQLFCNANMPTGTVFPSLSFLSRSA